MMNRFSSRLHKLDVSFLNNRLQNAKSYDRIAGYFSSSLLEVAGEAVSSVTGKVRIVCNSDLDERDVATAKAAEMAIRREWCGKEPEKLPELAYPRFKKLFDLLVSGKLEVRVLPSHVHGLIHGKAGVITKENGTKTSFMGSSNETYAAWKMNYELVWEDDCEDAIEWVQNEFDYLWRHQDAQKLSEAVISDIGRIASRYEINVDKWKENPQPENTFVESPVYRKEAGLWAHQKYFVQKAFEVHKKWGARFVLADQVGLGKTIQLAMAAQLMALYGNKPVLILAPKTLIWQWQDEMLSLLDMPSAVWNGRQWVDENGVEHAANGIKNLKNCPRKVGILSQGLITSGGEAAVMLRSMEFECVVVDEAHRARRKRFTDRQRTTAGNRNNLMQFIYDISTKTRSLLLATATPVQIDPIEAYDMLDMLGVGSEQVYGNAWSRWANPTRTLEIVVEKQNVPEDELEVWDWMRNPFPPEDGNEIFFEQVRTRLDINEHRFVIPGDQIEKLTPPIRRKIKNNTTDFFNKHNPFIRHIIRRTRQYLENETDPSTNEKYLKPVVVELFGEKDNEAIALPGYLRDAYTTAEEFSNLLARRLQSAGFLKTMLLRRLGSSIEAGRITAEKMLSSWEQIDSEEDDDQDEENEEKKSDITAVSQSKTLTAKEKQLLQQFIDELEEHGEKDPKYGFLRQYLIGKKWLEMGCIVFSQYYDTIRWVANQLTVDLPEEPIAIYAGGTKSGIMLNGTFKPMLKDDIKAKVKSGELRLVLGTDSASEGLNLQRLGTLINLDLPWNPTKLEQRKGRIQRIGQIRDTVFIYNMRYRDSVEDRVHQLLSDRLKNIESLFGQIPDVLEDVWVEVALGDREKAKQIINNVPERHPFEIKYDKIENINWESCSVVLNAIERKNVLKEVW
ncbi:phospholipase D-like domain-containing protein [Chitinophagaceae bacterium LB-8]|uniref:Phospholipase D-like domain-containing protein n=1 Tax=Paraflavisolibacter caeni TaxID=2982496 RepID=A0A9X3B8A2_9BACT|nr:phospholipase D-like domain-containing anti-phage protein [Paraflavisolibacter caeni]MCU7550400.1 phospholipase D-like domain-containing protein [Paraflavisolibacter caeni]